jgi:mono/diheme cytochrome c family protein
MSKTIKNLALVAAALAFTAGSAFAQSDIYAAKCKMCHGATGAADTPTGKMMKVPPAADPAVKKMTVAQLETMISAGKGKMPAYKGKLTDAQITEMAKYFKALK